MNHKSKYNPQIHHRRSIRLNGYDYSQAGVYFITICCQDMICRFGNIINNEMELNEFGKTAHNEWLKLPQRFPNFELDVFQIMPNHIHGIMFLTVGAGFTPAQTGQPQMGQPQGIAPTKHNESNETGRPQGIAPTNGDIIGAYKSLVFKRCLDSYKLKNETMAKLWQRNYYEHIIKNEKSYHTISNYVITNPQNWNDDKFFK